MSRTSKIDTMMADAESEGFEMLFTVMMKSPDSHKARRHAVRLALSAKRVIKNKYNAAVKGWRWFSFNDGCAPYTGIEFLCCKR